MMGCKILFIFSMQCHIGRQAGTAACFMNFHHCFPDSEMGSNTRLYFSWFNAETTNFYLLIHASQIFQYSVRPPSRQVSASVQQPDDGSIGSINSHTH